MGRTHVLLAFYVTWPLTTDPSRNWGQERLMCTSISAGKEAKGFKVCCLGAGEGGVRRWREGRCFTIKTCLRLPVGLVIVRGCRGRGGLLDASVIRVACVGGGGRTANGAYGQRVAFRPTMVCWWSTNRGRGGEGWGALAYRHGECAHGGASSRLRKRRST